MEFAVNWIIFSAIVIAIGASIETRKFFPNRIPNCIFGGYAFFSTSYLYIPATFSWH